MAASEWRVHRAFCGVTEVSVVFLLYVVPGCSSAPVDEAPATAAATHAPATDLDGDGYTIAEGDCNDDNPQVHPGRGDAAIDDRDTNCDGIDGVDADGDEVASAESGGEDCDDADPAVPGEEVVNGIDDDCNGCVDDDFSPMVARYPHDLALGIIMSDPRERDFLFGIAQTAEANGWMDEACADGFSNCHVVPKGELWLDLADTPEAVVLSETTLFDPARFERASFVFIADDGLCHVWGEDGGLYDGLGCCLHAEILFVQ